MKWAGGWLVSTSGMMTLHLGEVYLNNKSLYETDNIEKVKNPVFDNSQDNSNPFIRRSVSQDPEGSLFKWHAEVTETETIIWANFHQYDPNKELVEINVRPAVFFPKEQGVNYIKVSGFKLSQAATQWAPRTARQDGLIGPNWSKGWIIENNEISNSKCSGISLGKERASGQNLWITENTLSGFNRELEAIFKAYSLGWNKDNIGSHLIRNNEILHCGQTGICGHLGSVFSSIENNYIHDINTKREFFGYELGCIKLHAAIDVIVRNNYLDNCLYGMWLDWQAIGTRVTGNVFINNDGWDLWTEVTHGPCLVDNNLFLSKINFYDMAQGVAMVHNLFAGQLSPRKELNRYTPYHVPHSTTVAGVMNFSNGDDRFYNNVFTVIPESTLPNKEKGLTDYDSLPAYYEGIYWDLNDRRPTEVQQRRVPFQLAMHVNANLYYNDVKPYANEKYNVTSSFDVHPVVEKRGNEFVLKLNFDNSINNIKTTPINTATLGSTYYSNGFYENPDGSPLAIDKDFLGNSRSLTNPKVGPFEQIQAGAQEIVIWRK
ncbi:hypothetical protein EZS27_025139 [termite gut metagenome]|uniref:Uncharacterized protein n=1 Tax=termite gut metagenome TaxID=433724 RepID=A0A5J4QV40_9ZZZZ